MKTIPTKFLAALLLCAGLGSGQPAFADAHSAFGKNEAAGAFADVNGVSLYYEIYGEGDPVVLLHGNDETIAAFGNQIPVFAEQYQVIAVDTRFHGQSGDQEDVPLSYEVFAADIVGLLDVLGHDSAAVVGFSDGGNTALSMAINYPDRISKLVAIGSNFAPDETAVYSDIRDVLIGALGSDELPARQRKLFTLLTEHPNFSIDQLNSIDTPSLIIAGDHDLIREEHTIEMYLSIPTAYLYIMPGTTHFPLTEQPELLNASVLTFLAEPYKDVDRFFFLR